MVGGFAKNQQPGYELLLWSDDAGLTRAPIIAWRIGDKYDAPQPVTLSNDEICGDTQAILSPNGEAVQGSLIFDSPGAWVQYVQGQEKAQAKGKLKVVE
jgi:hypothetical protein